MYHPARVHRIIPTSDEPVFFVKTWDGNAFTLAASDSLNPTTVSEDDIVLLDYYPNPEYDIPTARQTVAAVLDDEEGEQIWDEYQTMYDEQQAQQTGPMMQQQSPFEGNYFG